MLDIIISSETRIKLLIKFFLVKGNKSYLRSLEREFDESTNALRVELNRMIKARLLTSEFEGNRRYYRANPKHPLYEDIKNLVHKELGIEQIIDRITCCVGDLESAYIIGNFAQGINSDTIELALIGKNLDTDYINQLIPKAEKMINRKIKYMTLLPDQMDYFFKDKPKYLFWQAGGEDKS
jgi:DNA-binding transcriptional ArsR family regulator